MVVSGGITSGSATALRDKKTCKMDDYGEERQRTKMSMRIDPLPKLSHLQVPKKKNHANVFHPQYSPAYHQTKLV